MGKRYCQYCGYFFDEAAGRYGCPNCLAEGLEPEERTVTIPPHIRTTTTDQKLSLALRMFTAHVWLLQDPYRRALRGCVLACMERRARRVS